MLWKSLIITAMVSGGAGLAGCGAPSDRASRPAPTQSSSDISAFHAGLMVLDSHLDTPIRFHQSGYKFDRKGSWAEDGTHVDLYRMNEGGLDGGFWVIYIPQGPLNETAFQAVRNAALMRQTAIREFAARYNQQVELAFTRDDAVRILSADKKIVFQSMENAYPLGEDISLLETFYAGGLRMIGPVHFRNNQFADSATDIAPLHDGLSPLGEQLVREANHLGLILDGSHASDDAVRDMMALSTTPIVLSHSGPKGVFDHPRNLPDDLLRDIAAAGGVIQVNAYGAYLEELVPSAAREKALAGWTAEYGGDATGFSVDKLAAMRTARAQIDAEFPAPRSSFETFMAHLLYMLELVGPDHVGIGADWDGGGGVIGMDDVSQLPRITAALVDAGYSDSDIAKIWGENLLRVLADAEAARTSGLSSPVLVQ